MPTQKRFNQQQHNKFEYLSVWLSHSWQVRELVKQEYMYFREDLVSSLPGYFGCLQSWGKARHGPYRATWALPAKTAVEALPPLTNHLANTS